MAKVKILILNSVGDHFSQKTIDDEVDDINETLKGMLNFPLATGDTIKIIDVEDEE